MKNILLLVFVVIYGTGCVMYRDSHREFTITPWVPYAVTASYNADGSPIIPANELGSGYWGDDGNYYNYAVAGGGYWVGGVHFSGGHGGYRGGQGGGGEYYNRNTGNHGGNSHHQGGGNHGGGGQHR